MLEKPENKNILRALFEVRKEIGKITKDGDNPMFGHGYATLKNIMDTLQPLLDKHSLLLYSEFTQYTPLVSDSATRIGVTTTLTWIGDKDEMPETISVFFPIKEVSDSQQMGKAMTYGRRYNIGALFNLTFEEDDDDTGDSPKPTKTLKRAPQPINF